MTDIEHSDIDRVRLEQVEGIWVVFDEGKYPHDPPRPASGLEIVLHGQLQGAVEAMELARVELDTALAFLDPAPAFKGKRSVRLCIVRARHFIRGR